MVLAIFFSVSSLPSYVFAQQLTQTEMLNILSSLIQQIKDLQKQLIVLQEGEAPAVVDEDYDQSTSSRSLAQLDYVTTIPNNESKNVLLSGKNARLYGTYTNLPDVVKVVFKKNDDLLIKVRGTLDFANAIQFKTPQLSNGRYQMSVEWGDDNSDNISVQIGTTETIIIKTSYSRPGYNDEKVTLHLSGGTSSNYVDRWQLKFSCSSNIIEASAKVWGDVCEGADDLKIGSSSSSGDVDIPLVLRYSNTDSARLDIEIKALDDDGNIIGEKDMTIYPHKG